MKRLDEDFVKKCVKGQSQLRRVWKQKAGDRVLTRMNNDENKLEIDYYSKHLASKAGSMALRRVTDVWLPYDEQLQEVLDEQLHLGVGDLGWAYYWWLEGDGSTLVDCWLDFVFYKLFNMTWNFVDRDWVVLDDLEE